MPIPLMTNTIVFSDTQPTSEEKSSIKKTLEVRILFNHSAVVKFGLQR